MYEANIYVRQNNSSGKMRKKIIYIINIPIMNDLDLFVNVYHEIHTTIYIQDLFF